MKYIQSTLDKYTAILTESGYIIRYERGTFQSGWCLLESRKIVVLNKFLSTEGRINTLQDIIAQIPISYDQLTLDSQKLLDSLLNKAERAAWFRKIPAYFVFICFSFVGWTYHPFKSVFSERAPARAFLWLVVIVWFVVRPIPATIVCAAASWFVQLPPPS